MFLACFASLVNCCTRRLKAAISAWLRSGSSLRAFGPKSGRNGSLMGRVADLHCTFLCAMLLTASERERQGTHARAVAPLAERPRHQRRQAPRGSTPLSVSAPRLSSCQLPAGSPLPRPGPGAARAARRHASHWQGEPRSGTRGAEAAASGQAGLETKEAARAAGHRRWRHPLPPAAVDGLSPRAEEAAGEARWS